ncbi:MAG TPA: sugar transferase [Patescibacteria group bacterium]|nr:sugar transferase [Patescibacteria group bacterium]
MRRNQLTFAVILLPLDYLALLAAAVTAYRLRFETLAGFRPAISLIAYHEYLAAAATLALGYLAIFALTGLYAIERPRRIVEETVKVISACTLGVMGLIILIFFRGELFASRFVILAAWLLSFLYVIVERLLVRLANRQLLKRGIGARRAIVVGGGDRATEAIVAEFSRNPELGYRIVKRFPRWDAAAAAEAAALCANDGAEELFVTDPDTGKEAMQALIEFAEDRHLTFRYAADTLAAHAALMSTTIAGIPVIEVKRTRLEGWGRVYKRVFDVIASLVLIILASPFMLIAAIAVKLDSKGPIIFKNERVGHEGRRFKAFKFRSMRSDLSVGEQFAGQQAALDLERKLIEERGIKAGPVYKIKDDPRVTRVGKFIRRYSIDELPQFFNVLKGDMSLVGPRPHQPREVEKYERHHRRVLMIRPGITGLAQVSGRSDLSFEDEVRLDTFYIENWTPLMDVAIVFKTPFAVFSRKGAY